MSTFLASLPKQPTTRATATNVSYDVDRVSGIEPQHVLKKRIHKNFRTPLTEVEQDIFNLLTQQEGWDGYDTPTPDDASIKRACLWVRELYRDVRAVLWIKPRVSADEDGAVVFEWWKGRKKLSVYVSPMISEYVKVEKVGSSVEMEEGFIGTPKDRRMLWRWLIS